jgi:hypothetical protein
MDFIYNCKRKWSFFSKKKEPLYPKWNERVQHSFQLSQEVAMKSIIIFEKKAKNWQKKVLLFPPTFLFKR